MVPLDATATPPRRYSAEIVDRQIIFQGRSYRPGDRIEISGADVDILRSAGVIGDLKRLAPAVEMATVAAPENASRNYGRKGR
jgi:hypothetical protein